MSKIAIVAAKRTPIGAFQGKFATLSAAQLGSAAIRASLDQAQLDPSVVQSAIMGNVLSAGLGQAPARQAVLGSGLPNSVTTSTVNKVCGSGMKAVMSACDMLRTGQCDVMVAGGMESMSNAPYLLPHARSGMRMGNKIVVDAMVNDGLLDPYSGNHMGLLAEKLVEKKNYSRKNLDDFALRSVQRAQRAVHSQLFSPEIAAVEVKKKNEIERVLEDEQPALCKPDKVANLKPVFKKDGSITAANASSINDGAAALVLVAEERLSLLNVKPIAWIHSYVEYAHDPDFFTSAPIPAIHKLLQRNNFTVADIDLWEINEAFAVVAMAAIDEYRIDPDKVNIYGGACALGHPIGCSGARLLVTLLNALQQNNCQRGLATLCIGGGESTAMIVEMAK